MAVTAVPVRNRRGESLDFTIEYCTMTLTGTYATGGFSFNPIGIPAATPGASPVGGNTVWDTEWRSPTANNYISTFTAATASTPATLVTKILNPAGTELTNGATLPDASIAFLITKGKK